MAHSNKKYLTQRNISEVTKYYYTQPNLGQSLINYNQLFIFSSILYYLWKFTPQI